MNTYGDIFRLTTFGESHGVAVGGVIDGCPSCLKIDIDSIQRALSRRRGDVELGSSARAAAEDDEVEFLSGLTAENITLGTPIAFMVMNKAQRPADYDDLKQVFRPGHADKSYYLKYGIRDHRGGGRASARETLSRVVAGGIARQCLGADGVSISAYVIEVGGMAYPTDEATALLRACQAEGDSIGGVVECKICGLRAGLGEPVFDKLQARLASAMLSIPAVKGFEYGAGFAAASMRGSLSNTIDDGIAGGISTGADICFRVAFKPTPSIRKEQEVEVLTDEGELLRERRSVHGRHDVCVALRAPVIVESMAALALINCK